VNGFPQKFICSFFCLALSAAFCFGGETLKAEPVAAEATSASESPPVLLFPIVKGDKWGFMDEAGKVVIEPQYDCAWDFTEGLARTQVGDLRGFIDSTGKWVVEPQYYLAWEFSEGLAAVLVGANKWGDARNGGSWGFIDKTGKMVIPARSSKADSFRCGRAIFRSNGDYLVDAKGRMTGTWCNGARSFSENMAAVPKGRQWGFFGLEGKFVIEPQYDAVRDFSEGLAAVKPAKQEKWGFIDKEGKIAIEPAFDDAQTFSDGLAAVAVAKEDAAADDKKKAAKKVLLWGCINKEGKIVIEPKFDFIAPFAEGLARIIVGEKHGFMNKEGKVVIEPKFDLAWEFSRGLARVESDGKIGYINKTGAFVWEPTK
jgi:hypothetical protein